MNKLREKHINELKDCLNNNFCDPDRFGHYKLGEYRFKMQKISMRLERKLGKKWCKIKSWYFKDLTQYILEDYIIRIKI